ncbi:MAG: IS21-like element helper ATPase IstB [Candidatus Eisenbacteria bacterium]
MTAKATPQPRVDLDTTRERLLKLNLLRASEHLDALISEAVQGNVSPHLFLDKLLEEELRHREERRIRTSLTLSGLPTGQTLANFDFSFQPSIERSRIETLGTCQWIRENRTLLIQGPPGVGKSHLAVALGMKAIEQGFGVNFYRLEVLLAALRRDAELTPARMRSKKYLAASLLIIDEVGFEPMTPQEASLFFRLVSYRYQRGSILITTNKGIKDWPEVLAGDEVLATAILDRLLHNSYVLDVKGRSYRLRDLERAVTAER